MEVILLERVEKLGHIGDVVNVKNGFARNYLLPNKKALRANEANKKLFEANRAKIEADNAEKRSVAEKDAGSVDGKTVKLIRQASNTGQLYGSVSARDIVEALAGEGAHVTKSQVVLARPIKGIGMHDVKIALHPEVAVTVHVNVARSPEEAELQAQGIDVIQAMFEEQAAPIAAEALAEEPEGEETGEAAEVAEASEEPETAKAAEEAPETASSQQASAEDTPAAEESEAEQE
jgi:large subunit ribosomal protein L9